MGRRDLRLSKKGMDGTEKVLKEKEQEEKKRERKVEGEAK